MYLWYFGLAVVAYYTLHSLLANSTVKKQFTQRLIPAHFYRLVYNALALLTILPLLWLYKVGEKSQLLATSLGIQLVGIVLIIASSILTYLALKQYDLSEFSGTLQYREKIRDNVGELNTSGLNSWVRHPLYFASLLFFWGLFWGFPNDYILLLAIISSIYLFVGAWLEEKKLVSIFGEAYKRYQKDVPMLFPNPFKGLF